MKRRTLREDGEAISTPTLSAGSGQIAGVGVGPQGEQGVDLSRRKQKTANTTFHVPTEMVSGTVVTESHKPVDLALWDAANAMAQDTYPDHPTPESVQFASAWYVEHGGEFASNVAKNEAVDRAALDTPTPTVDEIAQKHQVRATEIAQQLAKGIAIEREHTTDADTAKKIALDHLAEVPDYYDRLSQVEEDATPCWKGYEMVGMKMKDGREVPNCVPTTEANTPTDREWGTDSLTDIYAKDTPGQVMEALQTLADAWQKITSCQQCHRALSSREQKLGFRICDKCVSHNKGRVWGKDSDDEYVDEEADDCGCGTPRLGEAAPVPRRPLARVVVDYMYGKPGGSFVQTRTILAVSNLARPQARSESAVLAFLKKKHPKYDVILLNTDFRDASGRSVDESLTEAEYQGRTVELNKPFRTPDGPKKFSVYVKNDNDTVVKVNFGDPAMTIKRDDPERRKNFRARHNCDNPGPKWKARYWSCQWGWGSKALDEATTPAVLIAVPKDPRAGDGRGFWKIGNDVFRASVKGPTDIHGHPMDKRWESSLTHFTHYWNTYASHYQKTKEWK